jgi:hypothetical protein
LFQTPHLKGETYPEGGGQKSTDQTFTIGMIMTTYETANFFDHNGYKFQFIIWLFW